MLRGVYFAWQPTARRLCYLCAFETEEAWDGGTSEVDV